MEVQSSAQQSQPQVARSGPRPDQPIIDFEERLKQPMLPDAAKAVETAKRKFPEILQKLGWAIVLILLVMYAAIGLNGILIFLGGLLSIVALQAALLFRYIANENARARAKREADSQKAREDEFVIIGSEEAKVEARVSSEIVNERSQQSQCVASDRRPEIDSQLMGGQNSGGDTAENTFNTNNSQKLRKIDFTDRSSLRESILIKPSNSLIDTLANPADDEQLPISSRNRINSDEGGQATPSMSLIATNKDNQADADKMSQDQAPPIRDDSPFQLEKSTRPAGNVRSGALRTRRFERPTFLAECFEEPEPHYFFMYRDCQCHKRRNAEIRIAFMNKHQFVIDGLRCVQRFFEKLSVASNEHASTLQTLGVPSKSFLSAHAHSMLFDSEQEIFNCDSELFAGELSISNRGAPMFCEIRGKYQYHGKVLAEKAADWLQDMQVGKIPQVLQRVEELGKTFDEQFQVHSRLVLEKIASLHQREVIYRDTEDKLIQMIVEYRELVQYDEATKLQLKEQVQSFVKDRAEKRQDVTKRKTYSELVHLESQCKITHYELNNQSLELKDAYLQMNEAIEEQERFKAEMVEQLHELILEQAKVMLETMQGLFSQFELCETGQLADFQSLLEHPPAQVLRPFESLSPQSQPKLEIQQKETLIDVDDVEEANLSEYEEGDETPKRNECGRYSDLRGGSRSESVNQRKRQNSDVTGGAKFSTADRVEEKETFSDRVRNKEKGALRKSTGGDLEDKVSIHVFEPSDKSPNVEVDSEATPKKPKRKSSSSDRRLNFMNSTLVQSSKEALALDVDEGNLSETDCDVKIDILQKTLMADDQQKSMMELSHKKNTKKGGVAINVSPLCDPDEGGLATIQEEIEKAREDSKKDQSELAKMTLAIDELVAYLNNLADLNLAQQKAKKDAIDNQFKEIKNVITAGEFNLDDLHDDDSVRQNIAKQNDAAMARTDSKKYGPSTYILIFQSDFKGLVAYWEEQMDQHKQIAEQHEITANQLKLQAEQVQTFFDEVKTDLSDKYTEANKIGDKVAEQQDEVEKILKDLKLIEERRIEEEEAKRKEQEALEESKSRKSDDQTPQTPCIGVKQISTDSLSLNLVKNELKVENKGIKGYKAGSNLNLRSLLRPKGTPDEQTKKNSLAQSFNTSKNTSQGPDQERMPENRLRSQSVDDMQKIKGIKSMKSSNSFSIMSIDQVKPAYEGDLDASLSKNEGEVDDQLALAKSISHEKRSLSPQVTHIKQSREDNNQQSGIGYFFSYITSVFVSEQQLQSKQELEQRLETQLAELEQNQATYLRLSKDLGGNFKATKQLMQMRLLEWKRNLLSTVIDKSRLIVKYSQIDEINQVALDDLKKDEVQIHVKAFMWTMGDSVSYHEPHCANYRLFHLEQSDNPYSIKIKSVDTSALAEIEENKNQHGFNSASRYNENEEEFSSSSPRIADNRSITTGFMSKASKLNLNDRESCDWVNDLLAVFWEAWADAKVFHDLVLDAIYNAVNLDRDQSLAEIKCKALQLEGKPPRIIWVKNASVQNPGTKRPCFTIEGDAVVPGKVKILIETAYKINWPAYNWTSINLELFIIVSRISGRVRFQYSNDVEYHGGSYLQFLGKPAVTVDIEPVIFKQNPINLKSIPTVKTLLKDIINGVIEDLCFPSRVEMSVPCVLDPIYIDESGRRITQAAALQKRQSEEKKK